MNIQSKYSWVFGNIIVGTERRTGCVIISNENTLFSEINNDREDISDYSRHLFWSILEHSSRQKVGDVV